MRVFLVVALFALVALAPAQPVAAHPYWAATGKAIRTTDGAVFNVFASRSGIVDDQDVHHVGIRTEAKFAMFLTDPVFGTPTIFDPWLGTDDWFDHFDESGQTPIRQYAADSGSFGVDFHLEGIQVAATLTAVGHYQDLQLVLTLPNVLP